MNSPAETPPAPPAKEPRRGLGLRLKLILPLIITLALLALASLFGSMQLIRDASTASVQQRLNAAKEIVFREFKRHEEQLVTYITFLEQLHFLNDHIADSEDVGILQDRLYTTLEKAGVAVTFYPLEHESILPTAMKELFQQTRRSGQPRFRYTNELNGVPTLVAAAPLYANREVNKILVLSSAFGSDFLDKVVRPLGMGASLHDLSGKLLTSTSTDVSPMTLNIEQLRALAARGTLFTEHPSVDGTISHLFALIPVGDSDMVMLSVETSSAEVAVLETTMLVRLALTIGVALFLGAIIYFRAIATIIQPARELLSAAKAISRGNFSYRIVDIPNDELGEVAVTFNQMAGEIDAIYQEKSAKETESAIALQEAKARALLEHKNREIERVNEDLRAHLREVSALYQLNQAMVSATDLNTMFDRVLQTIIETLGCDHAVILLYNSRESQLEVARFAGLSHNTIENVKFRLDQGVTGQVAKTLKQIYVRDVTKDEHYLSYHDQVAVRGSFVATPLIVKGRLVGVLNLHKREIKAFHSSELKMIQAIGNQVAIVTENTRLIEKARDSANIDDVTGLANRRYFQEILKREVAQARRFNSSFTVVMCTIDDFDRYLQTHGRPQGETLLQRIGNLLLNNTRGIDLVCRFGSQEFAILLPKTRKDGGVAAAEKLRHAALAEEYPSTSGSQPAGRVTLSFGVAEFPDDSKNIYELINLADRALLQARRDGSNRTLAWDEFLEKEQPGDNSQA